MLILRALNRLSTPELQRMCRLLTNSVGASVDNVFAEGWEPLNMRPLESWLKNNQYSTDRHS